MTTVSGFSLPLSAPLQLSNVQPVSATASTTIISSFGSRNDRLLKKLNVFADLAETFEPEIEKLSPELLKAKTDEFKKRLADGEDVAQDSVDEKMRPYLKTAKLLMGKSLYSDSWLDL